MSHLHSSGRRRFLGAVVAASALFTGCSSDDQVRPPVQNDPTTTEGESWLSDAQNYDGYAVRTQRQPVRITVGAPSTNGHTAFDPAAVMVSPGTRVIWEWTNEGSEHGVSALDGDFQSEVTADSGHTYEQTFERSAVYRYYCPVHRADGMKGAVLVRSA